MSLTFDEHLQAWNTLIRSSETDARGLARRYVLEHMLDEVVARVRARLSADGEEIEPPDLLVSVAGFSPETTVIACRALQPRRLVVITSEGADVGLNEIADHVLGPGRLAQKDFNHQLCDAVNPMEIYSTVKKEIAALERRLKRRPVAVIDITGGKKVMSASASLAAWQLDLRICYIDTDYAADLAKPMPGTERMLLFKSPSALFGDDDLRAAQGVFNSAAYEAAGKQFDELAKRLSAPVQARFLGALSRLYLAWRELDLEQLERVRGEIEPQLADPQVTQLPLGEDLFRRVRLQVAFLRRLVDRERLAMVLSTFLVGAHYREVRRRDFAALFFYRTIEGCFQARLEIQHPGFQCSRPDYDLLTPEHPDLRERFNAICGGVLDKHEARGLPDKLSYLDSAMVLAAIGDELLVALSSQHSGHASLLKALRGVGESRNQSVLAHGTTTVTEEQLKRLEVQSRKVLLAFWTLHGSEQDPDGTLRDLAFVRLPA